MTEVVVISTAKIQPYIFGSNRLRENIGASYLVHQVTNNWPSEWLESNPEAGKVIYPGGGRFVVQFDSPTKASAFTRDLSVRALEEAPNLQLRIARAEYNSGGLRDAVKRTFKELSHQKHAPQPSVPLLSLGVTRLCQSSGFPAVGLTTPIEDDPTSCYPASAEILAKIVNTGEANRLLGETVPPAGDFRYPYDLDNLGRSMDENSYIAVVHADGNGIGNRVKNILENAQSDREYVDQIRDFSEKLNKASQAALKKTVDSLQAQVEDGRIKHPSIARLEIELKPDVQMGGLFLPFRPIVFGGDDVTFVCDGRIGLSLALVYLKAFETMTEIVGLPGGKATASAGVAVVKTHYPFARAYALSASLAESAKKYRLNLRDQHPSWDGACLDWHIALSGLSGELEEIRRREYTTVQGRLTLRPVTLMENPEDNSRSWPAIEESLTVFQKDWAGKHNKTKALRDALRDGEEAVKKFKLIYSTDLPRTGDYWETGWWNGACGFFDALELLDLHLPLVEKEYTHAS